MRMIARRSLSEAEIRGRLAAKGVPPPPAEAAVARLRELGLVDDPRLCRAAAVRLAGERGYGARRIERALRDRGFAGDLVEAAVREAAPPSGEAAAARRALARRYRGGLPPGSREAARALRFLYARGFSPDACRRAVLGPSSGAGEGEE